MPEVEEKQAGAADQNQMGETGEKNLDAAGQDITGETIGAADQKDAPEELTEREKGLLAAKQAETEKRQAAEQRAELAQQQFQLLQANQQVQTQTVQQKQPQDMFAEGGLEDTDLVNVGQVRQYAQQIQQQQGLQQGQHALQTFLNEHSDYSQKVGQTNAAGQFIAAEPLRQALQANPALQGTLGNPLTAPILAYEIVAGFEAQQELGKQVAVNTEKEAQEKLKAKTSPLSPAAVTGSGGGGDIASQISDISDPDQRAKLQKTVDDMLSGKYD